MERWGEKKVCLANTADCLYRRLLACQKQWLVGLDGLTDTELYKDLLGRNHKTVTGLQRQLTDLLETHPEDDWLMEYFCCQWEDHRQEAVHRVME